MHAICYDFGPSECSFEIILPIYEIILIAEGSKGALICPFTNLKIDII